MCDSYSGDYLIRGLDYELHIEYLCKDWICTDTDKEWLLRHLVEGSKRDKVREAICTQTTSIELTLLLIEPLVLPHSSKPSICKMD